MPNQGPQHRAVEDLPAVRQGDQGLVAQLQVSYKFVIYKLVTFLQVSYKFVSYKLVTSL